MLNRFRRLGRWRQLALRCAALAILAAIFLTLDPPEDTFFWDNVFDLGHIVLFASVTALIFSALGIVLPGIRLGPRLLLTAASAVSLAVGSEVIQLFQYDRDASIGDVGRDVAGSLAYLLLTVATSRAWRIAPVVRAGLAVAAVVVLSAAVFPFLRTMSYYQARDEAFPVLLRFDGSDWEKRLLTVRDASFSQNEPGADQLLSTRTIRLDLSPAVYPGWSYAEVHADWTGFKRLGFTIVSDSDEPLKLRLRIIDRKYNRRFEDRYNMTIDVTRGVYPISVPIEDIRTSPQGREFELTEVRGIALYALNLKKPTHIHLTSLQLE